MASQLPLGPYPESPGYKERDTSRISAGRAALRAPTLKARCLSQFKSSPRGFTADEIAAALNETVLSVRPRVAELAKLGWLVDAGYRRENESGHKAIVWILDESRR